MPPLDRAIALAERDYIAVLVAENLYFDMPRMREIFFDENPPVAECRRRFARSRFQSALELRGFGDDAHPASASSRGSLDQDRISGDCAANSRAAEISAVSIPGTTGTPAATAIRRAATLSPSAAITSGRGPTNTICASAAACANSGRSERNP